MAAGDGGANPWVFSRPDGTVMAAPPPPLPAGDHTDLVRQNRRLGLDISPTTGVPGWSGEHLDLNLALDTLFSLDRRTPPTDRSA